MAKTWLEKFHNGRKPVIETCTKDFSGIPAGEKFLISTPEEIDQYIKSIPRSKSIGFQTMKKDLALKHGVEYCCPLTTGIFTRIISELAFQNYSKNKNINDITPFWRLIDSKTPLAKKLSFGLDFIKEMRMAEGLPL